MNICDFCKHNHPIQWWDDCYDCVGNHSAFEPNSELTQILLNSGFKMNKEKMITKIVLGFPGVGKSYMKEKFKCTTTKVLDSDSSNFDKTNFPSNYIEYIKSNIDKYDYILISTHKEVREAILKDDFIQNNAIIAICYPKLELKYSWLIRLANRGNSKEFIELISDNYDTWIKEIESENWIHRLPIETPNEYLSNLTYRLRNFFRKD